MFKHATLNRSYRLVWSELRNTWIAVSEIARACGKRSSGAVAATILLAMGASNGAMADALSPTTLPTGGQVVAGQVGIMSSGARMDVTQTTNSAIVNWDSFSIGTQAQVNFAQPSSASVILNRVLGGDASSILGRMTSNGSIFLTNPAGILFASGAQVDVGGLVASSLGISDANFLAGSYQFDKTGVGGAVVNQGTINATGGGIVALIAPQVSNAGTIVATNGSVGLAAGDSVHLDFDHDGLLTFQVNMSAAAARADNHGLIIADGGRVVMTAQAKDALLSTVLNNDGVIRARSLETRNGEIWLGGGASGVVSVSGTLDASGTETGQSGGSIKVLGDKVGLFSQAKVDVSGVGAGGTALIGGNWQGKGSEQNASATYVGSEVSIHADAVGVGNGGKVVIWSDGSTRFYGSLSARGGANSGDGGKAEVSGKQNLTFAGKADLAAPKGQTGAVLLDPDDLYVGADPTNGAVVEPDGDTDPTTFFAQTNPNDYYVLAASLAGDTAYTLQANHDVIFNASVAFGSAGANTVVVTAANNIQSTGFSVSTAGGALTLNSATMALGALDTGAGLLTINNSGAATQSAAFAGTGGLTKTGAGTLTLSATNTYTGATTVSAGTLTLGHATNTLADASTVVVSGGTLDLGGNADTVAGVQQTGGTIQNGTLTSTTAFDMQAGTASANLAGAVGLDKTTAGTTTLSGTNTYSGLTTISSGVLAANSASALGSTAGGTTVVAGAGLQLNGASIGAEPLTLNGSGVGGVGALSSTGSSSFGGAITLASNTTIGSTGSLALNGTVDGGFDLAINSTSAVTIGGNVGVGAALTSLATDTGGSTVIGSGVVIRTSGTQVYLDAVTAPSVTLTSTGSSITAVNAANDFGTLSLNGSNATIRDGSGITLGTSALNVGGGSKFLDLTAGGDVTQSGALTVVNDLWISASGEISLKTLNTLSGTVSLIAGAGKDVWLNASRIEVGVSRLSNASSVLVGISGEHVTLEAPSGAAFIGNGANGLVKAMASLSSTPALTIKATGAIGSSPTDALNVETSGLVKVEGDGVGDGTINLKGDDKIQPKYEFSGDLLHRKVLYNGNEATNAQLTGALDAAYLDIRNQTTEIRESGFAKENASKVLRRGVVTSAGPGQPAVDDSTGMAGMQECEGSFSGGALSCQ